MPFTIIAPVFFMDNFLGKWMAADIAKGRLSLALPSTRRLQQIAVADIAQFAVFVDGHQVGGVHTVDAHHVLGQWQSITIAGDFDPYIDYTGRVTGYVVVNLAEEMGDYDWRLADTNIWKVERMLLDRGVALEEVSWRA